MSSPLLTLLVEVCLRGSLFFLLVCITAGFLRKADPALRHMLWFVSLLCFIIVPAFYSVVPRFSIPLPSIRIIGLDTGSAAMETGVLVLQPGAPGLQEIVSQPRYLEIAAFLIWLLGAVALAGRGLVAKVGLVRIMRGTARIGGQVGEEIRAFVEELLPGRHVHILKSPLCGGPVTFGILRPVIVIPDQGAEAFSERLYMILAHELSHVKRHDVFTGSIGYLICSIFWFIPFTWIAYARQRVEQEKACDLTAARFGGKKTVYAEMLIRMSREARTPIELSFFTAKVGGRNALAERVKSLLSTKLRRSSMRKSTFALCVGAALAAILALTAIRSIPAFGEEKKPIAKIELVKPDGSTIVFEGEGITAADIPVGWPLGGDSHGVITTRFGLTKDPFTNQDYFHNGIDIAWTLGTPVVAVARGTVIEVGFDDVRGEYVTIAHACGLQTHYSHLKTDVPVAVGNSVDVGRTIGYLGGTGRSTGPHIQYDVSRGAEFLDPMDFTGGHLK